MDKTPLPIALAAARAMAWKPGRSAEAFVDGDLEVRFTAGPTNGPQTPHLRDELYIVASGTARYRTEDKLTDVGPGDLLFAAAHAPHGFEDFSDDFAIWIIFYGPVKPAPP
jgi:mannose-6-phosphate isomerase-like protein (cupin superfamily)